MNSLIYLYKILYKSMQSIDTQWLAKFINDKLVGLWRQFGKKALTK